MLPLLATISLPCSHFIAIYYLVWFSHSGLLYCGGILLFWFWWLIVVYGCLVVECTAAAAAAVCRWIGRSLGLGITVVMLPPFYSCNSPSAGRYKCLNVRSCPNMISPKECQLLMSKDIKLKYNVYIWVTASNALDNATAPLWVVPTRNRGILRVLGAAVLGGYCFINFFLFFVKFFEIWLLIP